MILKYLVSLFVAAGLLFFSNIYSMVKSVDDIGRDIPIAKRDLHRARSAPAGPSLLRYKASHYDKIRRLKKVVSEILLLDTEENNLSEEDELLHKFKSYVLKPYYNNYRLNLLNKERLLFVINFNNFFNENRDLFLNIYKSVQDVLISHSDKFYESRQFSYIPTEEIYKSENDSIKLSIEIIYDISQERSGYYGVFNLEHNCLSNPQRIRSRVISYFLLYILLEEFNHTKKERHYSDNSCFVKVFVFLSTR